MDDQFSRAIFASADEPRRTELASALASELAARMGAAPDFHRKAGALIEELRALGHDLWSFDESDDMEIWCPNYHTRSGPGIVVTFTTDGVEVVWSAANC